LDNNLDKACKNGALLTVRRNFICSIRASKLVRFAFTESLTGAISPFTHPPLYDLDDEPDAHENGQKRGEKREAKVGLHLQRPLSMPSPA
jgi:hypothetical protein